jgi:methionyl-tRNA formyltransferase
VKVVVLTGDQPNQWALLHKLAREVDLTAVVLSQNMPRKAPRRRLRLLANRLEGRVLGRPFVKAWFQVLARYRERYGGPPLVPVVRVDNVNDQGTLDAIEAHAPDLVVVSGTNLVGKAVIGAAQRGRGIVNLHTGISPYIKGGPNCTNWCLATGKFHLIGNTVMWLDPGIDTGPLIASERTPLTGAETLSDLHYKVLEHAHDLYLRSIVAIRDGRPVSRVPQDQIAQGMTFYNADWSAGAMARAYLNFRLRYPRHDPAAEPHGSPLRLVPLPPPA